MRIPEQQHLRAGGAGQQSPSVRIARICAMGSAQAIIAAQFQDHNARAVHSRARGSRRETARRGFAADAGIDDLVTVTLFLEPRLEQFHPALFYAREPVAGADAIAEYENHGCLGVSRGGCKRSRRIGPKPFHERS